MLGPALSSRWPSYATGLHANLPISVQRSRPFGPLVAGAAAEVNERARLFLTAHRAAFLIQGAWFRSKARRDER